MKAAVLSAMLVAAWAAPVRAQVIADVQVTPDRVDLKPGQEARLFAAAYDPQGRIISGATITYLSSDTSIATVGPDGSVAGRLPGTVLIEAVAGGRRDSSLVSIEGPSTTASAEPAGPVALVTGIILEPASLSLLPLEPARLLAHVSTADSSTPPMVSLTWRSGDSHIAAVDRDGVIVGIAPGVTTITASAANGVSGTVAVSVDTAAFTTPERITLGPGEADTLHAVVPSQDGRRLSAGLTWTSADTSVAAVLPGGVVVARNPGQTDVQVRGYGMTGHVQVMVHQPVAGFTITPKASDGPVTVPVSTSRRFDARAEDASGNPVADVQVSFAVADTSIVQFSAATRTLSARRIGSTTLTARLDGFDPVVWTVNVIPVNVALDRGRVALRVGDRVQLAARLVDGDGAVVPGVTGPVTWTSARPAIASVANGAISAAALGHTLIRASTPWGTADSVEVFVNGDILISSDRAARGGVGVYEVRLAEPDVFVPVLADTSTNLHASYSPDRTRIAFSSNRSGTFDIWVMDADGSALTRVTSGPGAETEPVWTPDGKRIVYTASTGGQTQIASSGVDGSDPQTLTDTPGGNISPAVSPDGRIIAFASGRGGNYEIFEMGIDGTNVRRITATPQREQAPQFFSNGDLLYATDRPKGGSRIVKQSGTTLKALAETDDAVLALALSPDGRRYIYLAGKQVERGGDRAEYRLVAQPTDGTSQVVIIPLRIGEQAATPSF
jgi:uncharacterized protein YjdB